MDFHWLVLDFKKRYNPSICHAEPKLQREFHWWSDTKPWPCPAMFLWKTKNAYIYICYYHGCQSRTQRIACQYNGWFHASTAWQVPEVWSMGAPMLTEFPAPFIDAQSGLDQGSFLKISLTHRARFSGSSEQDWEVKRHEFVLMPYLHGYQGL